MRKSHQLKSRGKRDEGDSRKRVPYEMVVFGQGSEPPRGIGVDFSVPIRGLWLYM